MLPRGVGEQPYGAFDAHMIKSRSGNESKETDEMDVRRRRKAG